MQRRAPTDTQAGMGAPLAISQLLALQVIRRALRSDAAGIGWREVGRAFRLAHAEMLRRQGVGLVVADEGAALLTRHEKRLLRAVAAAQVPDPALVDNLIFALAPGRTLRPLLAGAVERLAAGLEEHGHALPLSAVAATTAIPLPIIA